MPLRLNNIAIAVLAAAAFTCSIFGQQPTPAPSPVSTPQDRPATGRNTPAQYTAEQIAESVLFIYGLGGGRTILDQIRKTTFERGRIAVTNSSGQTERAAYQRWVTRGENSRKDKIRFEQDFPAARYSLVFNDEKVFGIFEESSFVPREDAARGFENQTFRNIDALLRYKENGSKLEMAEREKLMGVEFYVIDVTDTKELKTRFFVSVKTFRIMQLEYEDSGVKFRRKFYDYRYAQGTLVPFRSVLWADDKIVEETNVGTVTFGQRVDEGLFIAG